MSAANSRKLAAAKRLKRRNYPVHKKILLHPISIFGLLCIGVFIAGWTFQVVADTVITSVIEAPPLQDGAIITSPNDGATFSTSPIIITGTCPNNSYVKLYQNSVFDGVAWCSPNNTFSIESSLFIGINVLLAQAYNETDLAGPITPSIRVTYNPPNNLVAPANSQVGKISKTTNSTLSTNHTPLPLLVGSDFHFKTFTVRNQFSWDIKLEGGTPPYELRIVWGDGQSSNIHFTTDPLFTIKHTFKTAGYYSIIIQASDSGNQQKSFQLAALITNSNGLIPGVTSPTNKPSQLSLLSDLESNIGHQKWLLVAWPAYLTVFLMTISFWLGEKQEFFHLKVR